MKFSVTELVGGYFTPENGLGQITPGYYEEKTAITGSYFPLVQNNHELLRYFVITFGYFTPKNGFFSSGYFNVFFGK